MKRITLVLGLISISISIKAQNFSTDINVTSDGGAEMNLLNTSSNIKWQMVSGFNGGFEIGNVNAGIIDNLAPFYINQSGQVGIGTTNPNEPLCINDISGKFSFGRPGSEMNNRFTIDAASGYENQIYFRSRPGRIFTSSNQNLTLGNSQTSNSLVISGISGKVGIGTNSPDELLHVSKGNVKFEFNSQFGNDPIIEFENEGTNADIRQSFYRWSGNTNLYWGTRFEREANTGFKIQMASTSALGSHSFIDALTILNNGNIGLGTNSTGTHRLAVEGSIGAREIKVEASGWSDFVFENDYKLLSLEEVEEHINENGHLPEIPNEADVTENGINLGEMNTKLLQKIEELTLYLIEQNKEIKSQKAEIESLKAKIESRESN